MHELAITESVVAGVLERVAGARVTRVVLEIGALSGVAPDAIRFCFDLCARGTRLEGAELEIAVTPGRARCRDCGEDLIAQDLLARCRCGSDDLDFLRGRELRIREVEVT